MRVIAKMIKEMVMEFIITVMEIDMKDIGKII